MQKQIWKILAIIFMILCTLELLYIGWMFKVGTEGEENEIKCSVICEEDYNSPFYYDWYDKLCYCVKDGETIHREVME